jgi:queuine tRNA-ribosyltransferase
MQEIRDAIDGDRFHAFRLQFNADRNRGI